MVLTQGYVSSLNLQSETLRNHLYGLRLQLEAWNTVGDNLSEATASGLSCCAGSLIVESIFDSYNAFSGTCASIGGM